MRALRTCFRPIALVVALVAAPLVSASAAVTPVPITSCDQTVTGSGYLVGDLDCSANGGVHFFIKGNLEMRGFTLTGSVLCGGSCTIYGPGRITGSREHAVRATVKVTVLDVDITGNAGDGIQAHNFAETAVAIVKNCTITGNGGAGVNADRMGKISGSIISGNGTHGLRIGTSTCRRGRLIVIGSAITGNGVGAECGVSNACADVASCRRPRMLGPASCGTSYVLGSGVPGASWNVCSLD